MITSCVQHLIYDAIYVATKDTVYENTDSCHLSQIYCFMLPLEDIITTSEVVIMTNIVVNEAISLLKEKDYDSFIY